jgi:hypothetical protein
MTSNFLELFIIEPKEGTTFQSPEVKQDLQWTLDQCVSGIGGISFSFRQSTTHPNRPLFFSCWDSKASYDDLDIRGVTPKMLKKLVSSISLPPLAVYSLLMENEERRKVEFDAEILGVTAWHVREGCREDFQTQAEKKGMIGAWYVPKGVPPRPRVMPSDDMELKIIEEGEIRAKARIEMPTPNIWISFSTDVMESKVEDFRDAVKGYVERAEGGRYEKYLSG